MAKEMLSQMTTRQKTILASMIVVVLIIIWQVMSLFPSTPKMPPPPPKVAAGASGGNVGGSANSPMPADSSLNPPTDQPQLRQANTVANDSQFLKMQKQTEEKYVGKLNELEELKIQRQIAETNQAISAAKLATVTAEKDISDLLTKPTPVPVPPSAYANQLANTPSIVTGEAPPIPPPIVKTEPLIEYSVISVSMQMNKWSAVLGYQGKLFNVNIGDVLPVDGSMVVDINRNRVILKKEGKIRRLNMVSSI